MASMIASLANFGGTKMIDTSAPVFVDGLDDGAEHRQFDVVAVLVVVRHRRSGLAGVDAADDLGARLEHPRGVRGGLAAGDALDDDLVVLGSERLTCLSYASFQAARGFGGLGGRDVGGFVHRADLGHERVVGLGAGCGGPRRRCCRRAATTSGLLASSPRICERLDDAVGDGVARGDAAEHVDEHALDLRVVAG